MSRRRGCWAAFLSAVALVAPATAGAADFTVDTTQDRVDAAPGNGECAAANGRCALRAAIQEANALTGADAVLLPKGTFELTRSPDAAEGSGEGDLDLLEALTIQGKGKGKTIVRQAVKDRVFLSDAPPAGTLGGAVISRLAITGGRVADFYGGGVLGRDGVLALDRVAVRGNTLIQKINNTSLGGGVAQLDGLLDVRRSVIASNEVRGTITTSGAGGGGLFVHFDATGEVSDTKIAGNKAHKAFNPRGGAAYLQGPTAIRTTTVSGNTAVLGGAFHKDSNGALEVTRSTISGNTATRGGALHGAASAAMNFTNTTVSGNRLRRSESAEDSGAAFWIERGVLRLISTTVTDHTLAPGQATVALTDDPLPGGTQADILGSILSNPRAECAGEEMLDEIAQNVLGDASCVGGLSPNLVADPRLKPLALNPGPGPGQPTRTHALKPSSPAVDFATTICPPPATDQRGVSRPQGAACDSGAFERRVP